MPESKEFDGTLLDDGTMDTVAEVTDKATGKVREFRYSDSSEYRDEDSGALDEDQFFNDVVFPDAACEEW